MNFFPTFFFGLSNSLNMTTHINLGPIQGLILLGKNYEFWALRMKSFLQAQECWDPVDLGYVESYLASLTAMTNQ
jgi:hypothetical protein